LRLRTFIGPDSVKAAKVAAAASLQSRIWPFADLFYRNQGEENTGYVTPAFLAKITAGAKVNGAQALVQPPPAAARTQLAADQALSSHYGFNATPSFLLGKTGSASPQPLEQVDVTNPSSFSSAINSQLGT